MLWSIGPLPIEGLSWRVAQTATYALSMWGSRDVITSIDFLEFSNRRSVVKCSVELTGYTFLYSANLN